MESSEECSFGRSLDAEDLTTVESVSAAEDEEIVVANYEDYSSEVLASSHDDDQGGEQVLGYLEVQPSDAENATIILQPQGIEFDGQHLILTRGEEGNEIIVVVSGEQDQPLEQSFAQSSVVHPGIISIESGLKNHTIVVDDAPQSLEFIETEEIPQGHEERHIFIEKNGEFSHMNSADHCAPGPSTAADPVWPTKETLQGKEDSTEMVFIPTPSVMLAPEETKHRKLMQLACIAHELQSADQKNNSGNTVEPLKDMECSLTISEASVIVTPQHVEEDINANVVLSHNNSESLNVMEHETTQDTREDECEVNSNFSVESDVHAVDNISTFPGYAPTRTIDNAVSVIHATTTELRDDVSENECFSSGISSHNICENKDDSAIFEDKSDSTVCDEYSVKDLNSDYVSKANCTVSDDSVYTFQEDRSDETVCNNKKEGVVYGKKRENPPDSSFFTVSKTSINQSHDENSNLAVILDDDGGSKLSDSNSIPSKTIGLDLTNKESIMDCSSYGVEDNSSVSLVKGAQKLNVMDSVDNNEKSLCDINTYNEMESRMEEDSHSSEISSRDSCIVVVEDDESKGDNACDSNLSAHGFESNPTVDDVDMAEVINETTNKNEDINSLHSASEYVGQNEVPGDISSDLSVVDSDITVDSGIKLHNTNNFSTVSSISDKVESDKTLLDDGRNSPQHLSQQKSNICNNQKKSDGPSDLAVTMTNYDEAYESKVGVNSNKGKEVDELPSVCQNKDFIIPNNLESDMADTETSTSKSETTGADPENNIIKNLTFHGALDVNSTNENNLILQKASSSSVESVNPASNSEKEQHLTEANAFNICPANNETLVSELEEISCKQVNQLKSNTEMELLDSETKIIDSDLVVEETLVKPPKKTYIRKKKEIPAVDNKSQIDKEKIELFSCDDDLSGSIFNCENEVHDTVYEENIQKEPAESKSGEHLDDDDGDLSLFSDIKVSATYKRKRKSVPPIVRENRTRSLRPRSLNSKQSIENGTKETSDSDLKNKNSLDTYNSESIHWGDYLMGASFLSTKSTADSRRSSLSETSKKKSSWLSSHKRGRPKLSKPKKKSRLDWEKLVKSSPAKLKRQGSNNRRKLREKVKRQFMSHLNSNRFSQRLTRSLPVNRKRGRPRKRMAENARSSLPDSSGRKMACIRILFTENDNQPAQEDSQSSPKQFCCTNCSYGSNRVNNLIMHLKYCCNKQPVPEVIDYRIDDMERRQRIRGDDSSEKVKDKENPCLTNGSLPKRRDITQPECSGLSNSLALESDEDMGTDTNDTLKSKYGFADDDVVWTRVDDRFWPGLVCELDDVKASVMLISSPMKKGVKVTVEKLHTFDDAKWNKMLLFEGVALPHYDYFVKAVQASETFVRKKWLGSVKSGKEFFGIPDDDDFITENESSDCSDINDDSDYSCTDNDLEMSDLHHPSESKPQYNNLDIEKVQDCILQGNCNEHLLGIFTGDVKSDRQIKFFNEDPSVKRSLKTMAWFGPVDDEPTQARIVDNFHDLFKRRFTDKPPYIVSYIYEVWIPEAIVKAISLVNDISLEEAENIYDCNGTLDQNEITIEEIAKMYQGSETQLS